MAKSSKRVTRVRGRAPETFLTERQKARAAKKWIEKQHALHPCGDCSACCTVMQVDEIDKPEGAQCEHLRHEYDNGGCGIYADRPQSCKDFFCAYRHGLIGDGELLRPDKLGVMFDVAQKPPKGIMMLSAREVWPGAIEAAMPLLHQIAALGHVLYLIRGESRHFMGPEERVKVCMEAARRHLPLVMR